MLITSPSRMPSARATVSASSRARRDEMYLIAAYTAAGREPPAELMKALGGQRRET